MADRLEIENAEQCKALFALLNDSEKQTVRAVLRHIDEATLMPEQSLLVELGVLEKLLHDVQAGSTIAALITDIDAYAEAAIKEIGEEVRRERHIGALMGGIALCAIVLLVLSLYGIARGLANGQALMACTTSLDLGHVISFIAFLAGTRFFVMGDKTPTTTTHEKPETAPNSSVSCSSLAFCRWLPQRFSTCPWCLCCRRCMCSWPHCSCSFSGNSADVFNPSTTVLLMHGGFFVPSLLYWKQ